MEKYLVYVKSNRMFNLYADGMRIKDGVVTLYRTNKGKDGAVERVLLARFRL